MADRKNRRRIPILLLILFGFVVVSVQGFFLWRARDLDGTILQISPATDLRQLRDLAERLAWYRPADVDLMFRRAEYADQAGDSEVAAAILHGVPESSPQAGRARYLEGLVHRNAYRLDSAEQAFREALRIDPRMLEAHRALVGLLGVERRRADQLQALQAWVKSGFGTIEPLRLLGQSVVVIPPGTLDKSTDEGAVLEKALKVQPESRHIRPAYARFLRNRGESDLAIEKLTEWLSRNPDDVAARIELFATYVESGEIEKADKLVQEFGTAGADSPEYWMTLGDHQRNIGRREDSAKSYKKALALDPYHPETNYRLAESLRASGKTEEAAGILKTHETIRNLAETVAAVDSSRPTVMAILAAAKASASLGRSFEARAWATEALRIDRNNAEARAVVSRLAEKSNGP
ncbi:tetratricopeptide repeat protein [bacterium]|nr:tetratricopeptide repeat protein [bacterium]